MAVAAALALPMDPTGGSGGAAGWKQINCGARLAVHGGASSVKLSLCTAIHPLYTISTQRFGAAASETTMRPNFRWMTGTCTCR
jgi:hypothetical protein